MKQVQREYRVCKIKKYAHEFYKSSVNRSGLRYDCKECFKKADSKRYKTSSYRRTRSKKQRELRANPNYRTRILERDKRNASVARQRHPEQTRARLLMNQALKSGQLVRPEICSDCGVKPKPKFNGATRIQGHHHDYAMPLDVTWLCEKCHREAHRTLLTTEKGEEK